VKENTSLNIYPNPFIFSTKIIFNSPKTQKGVVDIFNLAGRKIKTLFKGDFEQGRNEIFWKPANNEQKIKPGIYIIFIEAQKSRITQKVVYKGF